MAEQEKKWKEMTRRERVVAVTAYIIFGAVLLAALASGVEQAKEEYAEYAKAPPGTRCTVNQRIFAPATREAQKKFRQARNLGDELGALELIEAREIVPLSAKTGVLVLETTTNIEDWLRWKFRRDPEVQEWFPADTGRPLQQQRVSLFKRRARVLDGDGRGKIVYIEDRFLEPVPAPEYRNPYR